MKYVRRLTRQFFCSAMIPPMRRNIADILLLLVCCVFVNFSLQAHSPSSTTPRESLSCCPPARAPTQWRSGQRANWRASIGDRSCQQSTISQQPHDAAIFRRSIPRRCSTIRSIPDGADLYAKEPALKITREDGNRDLVLKYVSHKIEGDDLDIVMKDINDAIEVTLHYHVYPHYGVLRRSATIRNGTKQTITVESAQAAAWYLPPGEGYELSYLSGRWAEEDQIQQEPIHPGMKVLESSKGHSSHNLNPWFAIDAGKTTEEIRGFFASLRMTA